MSELRQDRITGRWILMAPERAERPRAFRSDMVTDDPQEACPFCPGHEAMTPPSLYAVTAEGVPTEGTNWQVRVFPNLYPACRWEMEATSSRSEELPVQGAHEVIVETPHHSALSGLGDPTQWELALKTYALRARVQIQHASARCLVLLKNHGAAAGTTLSHPHAQLITLPVVPNQILRELESTTPNSTPVGSCETCREINESEARLVLEHSDFLAYTPYASSFPFEVHVAPRKHASFFWEIDENLLKPLAEMINDLWQRYTMELRNPALTTVICGIHPTQEGSHRYHWRVRFMPRIGVLGGLETGTDCFINPILPEEAAERLRAITP